MDYTNLLNLQTDKRSKVGIIGATRGYGYTLLAQIPKVKLIKAEGKTARLHITIHEGRYRQVRRMCQAAGLAVTRLKRVSEGELFLGELPLGKWRYLTKEEIAKL